MFTFLINELSTAEREVTRSNPGASLILNFFFISLTLTKKVIEILTKIRAKITIIAVQNRGPYYFIIICRCKEVLLSLFSYQMLASTLTVDEQSIYHKVYEIYILHCRSLTHTTLGAAICSSRNLGGCEGKRKEKLSCTLFLTILTCYACHVFTRSFHHKNDSPDSCSLLHIKERNRKISFRLKLRNRYF